MMQHWLDGVEKILRSESKDLKHLASLAGVDPRTIFRYADLSRCDLRGQDLRGLDFTGAILSGAHLDSQTLIDHEFDPRTGPKRYYRFSISSNIVKIVNSEAETRGYTYAIWYVKSLFETCNRLSSYSQFKSFCDSVIDREDVQSIVRFSPRNRLYTKYVQLNPWEFENSDRAFSHIEEHDRYSFILFMTIIFTKNNSHVYREIGELINDIIHNTAEPTRYISKF